MIEHPPAKSDYDKDEIIALVVQLQMNGEMKKIQDDYLYWDKIKYKTEIADKQKLWAAIKFQRFITKKETHFGKHTFTYPTTDYIQRSLHDFDLNTGGSLTSNIGIAETDKQKFIIDSLMEESISSSQMEGASTTRKVAKEMLRKELSPRNISDIMIVNNYITMKHIAQHKSEDLSPEKLLEIHKLITNSTLDNIEDEGRYRDNDDIFVEHTLMAEKVHQPPPQAELKGLLKDLCHFFNKDEHDFIHPIIKGIIIHFMTGWIHPFVDGNGRTARALFYWYMLKKGYWLTEYLSISRIIKGSKNQYERAYLCTEQDDNDLGYFITYNIQTMVKAYDALKQYIHKKQKQVIQAARFMKIPGVNERMAQIIKIIYDDPDRVLSSKELENRFMISNFTARQDLKHLVSLRFLEEVPVNGKKLNYIKSSLFDGQISALK